jgi:hypothetical protein
MEAYARLVGATNNSGQEHKLPAVCRMPWCVHTCHWFRQWCMGPAPWKRRVYNPGGSATLSSWFGCLKSLKRGFWGESGLKNDRQSKNMELRTYQDLKFPLLPLALSDRVQHSCASRTTKFHHLPFRPMGSDRDLGESTTPSMQHMVDKRKVET